MIKHILIFSVIVSLNVTLCHAGQDLSGMYTMSSGNVQLFLALQQNGDTVTGGMTSTTGSELKLTGKVMGSFCQGKCYDSQSQVFFNLYLEGEELYVQLIEPGADGNPDYSKLRELVFRRKNNASPQPQQVQPPQQPRAYQDQQPSNPLSSGTARNPLSKKPASLFSGSFEGDGLKLSLNENGGTVSGNLSFNNQTYSLSAKSNGTSMSGTFRSQEGEFPFKASLKGNTLSFETGGTLFTLNKASSGHSSNPLLQNKNTQPDSEGNQRNTPAARHPLQTSQSGSGQRITEKTDGFSFIPPDEWIARKDPNSGNYIMGSNSIPGLILMVPHNYNSLQEMVNQAGEGIVDEGIQMYPSTEVVTINSQCAGAQFSGTFQQVQAKGYVVGLVSPHGGGVMAICLTENGKYTDHHRQSAISLANSFQFFEPVVDRDLINWISAYYYSYVGSTERKLMLCPNGTFSMGSESSYSGTMSNQYGDQTGAWGAGSQNADAGRWTIKGDRQQGVLYMKFNDGKYAEVTYKVGGRGAFYFNNVKYGYAGPPNCK